VNVAAVPQTVRRIRAGSGLGDSIYLQSIARHLVGLGWQLRVCTSYPDVFPLPVQLAPFTRFDIDHRFHYLEGLDNTATNQFEDMCRGPTGMPGLSKVELRLDWQVRNSKLVERVQQVAGDRPILIVHAGREPMDRKDHFGSDLLPQASAVARALTVVRERYFAVAVGQGPRLYEPQVDLDLHNQTSVADLIDLVSISARALCQISFMLPLAESLGKPLLCVFAERGLVSRNPHLRKLTPAKVLCKPATDWQITDNDTLNNREMTLAFRDA
jgi:hypothetical protein